MKELYDKDSVIIPATQKQNGGFYLKPKVSIVGMLVMPKFEAHLRYYYFELMTRYP